MTTDSFLNPPTEAELNAQREYARNASRHEQPDALQSDPRTLGWMTGFPPPPDRRLSISEGHRGFPALRWTFSHMRELCPTRGVLRGPGPISTFPRAVRDDLDAVRFIDGTGVSRNFEESLALTYTDGIVVLHHGRIVYERYFGALDDESLHLAMSVTKSFVGTLVALLIHEGVLDETRPVTHWLPELASSGWAGASLRQVLDMTTSLNYDEIYADQHSTIWDYARATGAVPVPADYRGPRCVADYLPTVGPLDAHGAGFGYRTVNTEVLAWVMRRATGQSTARLLSDRIWRGLGAEQDAAFTLDPAGQENCGGGLNTALRDLARFGEMLRCEGSFNGRQILPAALTATLARGGDRRHFVAGGYPLLRGWSYANQWWVSHNALGMFEARGIHGQRIHIAPAAGLTIARYGSHPIAANSGNDPLTHPAFAALAEHLRREPGR